MVVILEDEVPEDPVEIPQAVEDLPGVWHRRDLDRGLPVVLDIPYAVLAPVDQHLANVEGIREPESCGLVRRRDGHRIEKAADNFLDLVAAAFAGLENTFRLNEDFA